MTAKSRSRTAGEGGKSDISTKQRFENKDLLLFESVMKCGGTTRMLSWLLEVDVIEKWKERLENALT
jgi:hypothetical protein